MNISLVMFKADGTRRDFPITKDRIIVGRTNQCDLRVPLSSVSRQHCELRVEGQVVKVRDLGSSNGTYHNSIRIQEAELAAGDEIGIGPVVFTLVVDSTPANIQPVRTILSGDLTGSSSSSSTGGQTVITKPAAMHGDGVMSRADDHDDHSPTVGMDDPITRLEAMAKLEDDSSSHIPIASEEDEARAS